MRIHREGYKYIIIASLLWAVIAYLSFRFLNPVIPILFWLVNITAFLFWFWVIWFFRLPSRVHSEGETLAVSPADGKVVVIEETYESEYFKDKRIQVSIFMSPLNVHVNRNPVSGIVKFFKYHPGKYLVAWDPKSSTDNERTTTVVENNQ